MLKYKSLRRLSGLFASPTPTFPMLFPKCRECGSRDTVTAIGLAEEPSYPKGAFGSIEKAFIPLQDLTKLSVPTVRGILVHYDVCARCGTRRCTKAEILSLPMPAGQVPGFPVAGFGKGG